MYFKQNIKYPSCFNTFQQWCNSNPLYLRIYNDLGSPKPFDVSLRDGIQNVAIDKINNYNLEKKLGIFNYISNKYNPSSFEVGSLVSKNVLPIMYNSDKLFKLTKNLNNSDKYLLIPSITKLNEALDLKCNNISLITSVSNDFTLKNTKKSLNETKTELLEIMINLYSSYKIYIPKVKLYISCINECPISGIIPLNLIIKEIIYYHEVIKPHYLCLSDTCGTLDLKTFKTLLKTLKSLELNNNKLSLHLHYNPKRSQETINIIHHALNNNIINFDVSYINSGGCSVTMINQKNINSNISYDLYYYALSTFIEKKSYNF